MALRVFSDFNLSFGKLEVEIFSEIIDQNIEAINAIEESTAAEYAENQAELKSLYATLSGDSLDEQPGIRIEWDNEMLHTELTAIRTVDTTANSFTLKVWNMKSAFDEFEIVQGDRIKFKYYWDDNPEVFSQYVGLINEITHVQDSSDLCTTIKASLEVEDVMYRLTAKRNGKPIITTWQDFESLISLKLGLDIPESDIIRFGPTLLPKPILTTGKTVGDLVNIVTRDLTEQEGKKIVWKKSKGKTELRFYPLNTGVSDEVASEQVMTIRYSDILVLKPFSDDTVNLNEIQLQIFGAPGLDIGSVFIIDYTSKLDYDETESEPQAIYLVDEKKDIIDLSNGFISTVYAHELIVPAGEEEEV